MDRTVSMSGGSEKLLGALSMASARSLSLGTSTISGVLFGTKPHAELRRSQIGGFAAVPGEANTSHRSAASSSTVRDQS
ncbi:hypothetical protein [Enhygromyxa salina]|uniref:hypothetical protein n=1 Tax=Enhygromyxa salina TaxID=215803 RepID=UPI00069914E4|nr:hypothetical protein [Enhygromyxa salina]